MLGEPISAVWRKAWGGSALTVFNLWKFSWVAEKFVFFILDMGHYQALFTLLFCWGQSLLCACKAAESNSNLIIIGLSWMLCVHIMKLHEIVSSTHWYWMQRQPQTQESRSFVSWGCESRKREKSRWSFKDGDTVGGGTVKACAWFTWERV